MFSCLVNFGIKLRRSDWVASSRLFTYLFTLGSYFTTQLAEAGRSASQVRRTAVATRDCLADRKG